MASSFLSQDQLAMLRAMDIQAWTSRVAAADIEPAPASTPRAAVPPDWQALASEASACTRCELHASRRNVVFGVGNASADWMIIGEAPGADEDRQGEPFVGRAGKLLNEMLRAVGFERGDVYIANILKCRPPNNRDPRPQEVAECFGYLRRQIELVSPKLIIAVGRVAAQNLLQREDPVGRLRGEVHRLEPFDVPVVVTYHPAYLLRSPGQKRKAWADLCLAREVGGA
jgi:DNA polymerase